MLGNLIATKKASAIPPAPKHAAINISLKKPKILLISVIPDIWKSGLIIFIVDLIIFF
jgi:hypothetical protein